MRLVKKKIACALAVSMLLAQTAGLAGGTLTLPQSIITIGEGAFSGARGFDAAVIPEGTQTISRLAFADTALQEVSLPSSIIEGGIADDAFAGSMLSVVRAPEASPAFAWALDTEYTLRSENAGYAYSVFGRAVTLDAYHGGGTEVVIPDEIAGCAVTGIGPTLFNGSSGAGWLTIPDSVASIAEDAFAGCAEDLLIRTTPGSAAMTFALSNSIDYQADTVYRALVIGQTYENTYLSLRGTKNDADGMAACLAKFEGTPFNVTERIDLTAEGILAAIPEIFGDAQPQDVSLFYYSGHGSASSNPELQGALVGVDGAGTVTVSQLRAALDEIPGRKIIIIDACLSGKHIPTASPSGAKSASAAKGGSDASIADAAAEGVDGAPNADAFTASFIEGFSGSATGGRRKGASKGGAASADRYFVMTAAAADENSYEANIGNFTYDGLFTYSLLRGCGYNCATRRFSNAEADANGNGVLAFQEAFAYTAENVENTIASWNSGVYDGDYYVQSAQVYPVNCNWFGLLRN